MLSPAGQDFACCLPVARRCVTALCLVQGLQDDDTRIRFVVADFILARGATHKAEEFRSALQQVVGMAQSSSNGALVENPYVQLQAFLRHDLFSIDDL